jgi:uncharacterized protein DUF3606
MADNWSKRQPKDTSRINLSEFGEVKYWTEMFGLSEIELREAVNKVGHTVEAVREHLRK